MQTAAGRFEHLIHERHVDASIDKRNGDVAGDGTSGSGSAA